MLIINNIKTKKVVKGIIKVIDKSAIAVEKTKNTIVNIKEKGENAYSSDSSVNEYVSQKVSFSSNGFVGKNVSKFNSKGRKSVNDTKNNIIKTKTKIKNIKSKLTEKRKIDKIKKNIKLSKQTIKNGKKVAVESIKTTNRARKLAVDTIKNSIHGIKTAVKVSTVAIKTIITGASALVSALTAGGWLALLIIIIICFIGLLFCTDFGIFFSSEKTREDGKTMDAIISEIENELYNKIENIKKDNVYDEYRINYNPSRWKEILAIYTVKVSDEKNVEILTLDEDKTNSLKEIYWEINNVNYEMILEEESTILSIEVSSKTLEQIMNTYNFTSKQKDRVNELMSEVYNDLWISVIIGNNMSNFICPVKSTFYITTMYSVEHQAIDVYSYFGDNIYSIFDGTIIIAKSDCVVGDLMCNSRAGNYVVVEHDGTGYYSSYMHLDNVNVNLGDKVIKGDLIGTMGNTGNVIPVPENEYSTNGTHLHFVLYKGDSYSNSTPVNPIMLFN